MVLAVSAHRETAAGFDIVDIVDIGYRFAGTVAVEDIGTGTGTGFGIDIVVDVESSDMAVGRPGRRAGWVLVEVVVPDIGKMVAVVEMEMEAEAKACCIQSAGVRAKGSGPPQSRPVEDQQRSPPLCGFVAVLLEGVDELAELAELASHLHCRC
jgi:hypothetical protein